MSDYLQSIEAFLQREDDFLLYTPDAAPDATWVPRLGSANYILEGHTPRLEENIFTWGLWYERADRKVAKTQLAPEVTVSTVFLGLDHNYSGEGPPLLFETMIFSPGGPYDQYQERYSTWEEAEAGHARAALLASG